MMEATETDVDFPQLSSQEDGSVDNIADGIMNLLDGDPNTGGKVEPKQEEKESEPEEETPDTSDKFTIKWQGQEREVSQDELIDFAQKGFDYTQKTQALANERNRLAPYEGLANLIKSDPVKANHIAAILAGQPQAPPPQQFEDPIEQLKFETIQKAKAEIRQEMAANLAPLHQQQVINQVKSDIQRDPEYPVIHERILDMVKSLPPALREDTFNRLNYDVKAYLETYQQFKSMKQAPEPKPVKKESRAPILESGGISAPEGIEGKAKAERMTKMKAKALRSGDPTAVADWLKASGAIDHLL
jgi:hypothetical protein